MEKLAKQTEKNKKEARTERRKNARGEGDEQKDMIVDLGGKTTEKKKEGPPSIDQITDLEVLYKMKAETLSRGKKQRIIKRIMALQGKGDITDKDGKIVPKEGGEVKEGEKPVTKPVDNKPNVKTIKKQEATKKVENMLKKREQKLETKKNKGKLNKEEEKIVKQAKNTKREKRRDRAAGDEDEFDELLKTYAGKLTKKVKEPAGPAFEEVVMSN